MKAHRLLITAAALTACRPHPVSIAPIPEHYTIDFDVPTTSETAHLPTGQAGPAGSREASPGASPETAACPQARWRQVANKAFGERETWPFEVRWAFLKAGKAVLTVEGIESVRERPAYHLSMDIRATGITGTIHPYRDRTDSWLDRDSLTTLRVRHSIRESHYQADETLVLDPVCRRFRKQTQRLDKKQTENKEGPLSPDMLDIYGALFYLRTLPLATGQTFDLALFAGDKAVPVTAVVGPKERVPVAAGSFDCFPIEMRTEDPSVAKKIQQIRWWVSADDRHIPVRIRMEIAIGHMTADLQK